MRLANATLGQLSKEVSRFSYDRNAQNIGIVHFGIGAFHRAHQAWYTDKAMDAGEINWAILGVSMRSADVANQLVPQDGLYTLSERSAALNKTRLIGAVQNVAVAVREREYIISTLAKSSTHIASFTITEKGYCRDANGSLDVELANSASFYPIIAAALRRRYEARLQGLTLMSCDNLAQNGIQLEKLMLEYLFHHDKQLADWFTSNCTCPSTMVDRIVPATTDNDRAELAAQIGLNDFGGVMTEPFSQWVIEDKFAGPRPKWENVGADLVADVRPYETAKLRMLNGAHSFLAYCGLNRGHTYVHEAISDSELRESVLKLMTLEAAPTIKAAAEQNLTSYAASLVNRFSNPALAHRLSQIAIDGSQKIPQRWLETLAYNARNRRQCPAILVGIAAWISHLQGANGPVDDPRAKELKAVLEGSTDKTLALFGFQKPMSSSWIPSESDRAIIAASS